MNVCWPLSLLVVLLAALGGCGDVLTSDRPAEHIYWLEAVSLQFGEAPTADLPDLIVTVRAIPGLDTDRILVKGPGAQLNYYAGARWPDHLPEVVTVAVRLSLESSGHFNRVESSSRTSHDQWALDLELREFFAVVTSTGTPPEVHVKLAGHAYCGSVNAALSVTTTAPAREDKLSEVIAAFQSAADQAITRLGAQVEDRCL